MEKVALLFPGQGCQYVGMGKSLYDDFYEAKYIFDEANEILNFDLKRICFEGRLSELNKISNMLPAIFTVSVAAFKVYEKEVGIVPQLAAGHSLGEYSALTCSGVISFSDALKIIKKRCTLAEKQIDYGHMTVINNINLSVVEEICKQHTNEKEFVSIACINSETQCVLAGHNRPLMQVEKIVMDLGAQVTPMLMSPPFHSTVMNSAAIELEKEIRKYKYEKSKWPIISNFSAEDHIEPEILINNLINQMKSQVKWTETINLVQSMGTKNIIEIGPQMTLGNLIKNKDIKTFSFGNKKDRDELKGYFQTKRNMEFKKVIIACMRAAVCTPNLNFDANEYERGVILPYERLEKILKDEGFEREEIIGEAINLLKTIFTTKKLPDIEKQERINQIFLDSSFSAKYFE